MAEDAEAAWGIAEAPRGLGRGEDVDEEGAERLVLSVECVLGHEEDALGGFR